MNSNVKVSVICYAYNHEKYIRDALEGFVSQKTDFLYEVIIHDDASTDSTAMIIREYEKKYPQIIKPIYQTINQYSQGISISEEYVYPKVRGEYVALCEGDDYWTDQYKLQKQFTAMEAHPEVDICAHATDVFNERLGKKTHTISPRNSNEIIPAEDVILGGGGFVATCSLFFRREICLKSPGFRLYLPIDYTTQIYGALRGGLLYLDDRMSVYRFLSSHSWSSKMHQDFSKMKRFNEQLIEMYRLLNEYTDGSYHEVINRKILIDEFELLVATDQYKDSLDRKYESIHQEKSKMFMLKLRIKSKIPILLKIRDTFFRR